MSRILFAPAATISSCVSKPRIPNFIWMKPSVFCGVFNPKMSRRCRINRPAQLRAVLLLAAAAVVVFVGGCRQDMQNQPKFIPLRSSEFFADHRSARDPIMGTVPWSKEPLNENTYFFTGKQGTGFGNDLPTP